MNVGLSILVSEEGLVLGRNNFLDKVRVKSIHPIFEIQRKYSYNYGTLFRHLVILMTLYASGRVRDISKFVLKKRMENINSN